MQRNIPMAMVNYISGKLAGNQIAQNAISVKDARGLFIEACKACVGILEATDNNDGPMVALIQSTVGIPQKQPWCMDFMQTCIAYAELMTGQKSPLKASESCLDVWDSASSDSRVKVSPLPGAIVIWQHLGSSQGHTGCVLAYHGSTFDAVEGNTESGSDDPNGPVVRDGGGVYFTHRSSKGTGDMVVIGFLKPF